MFPRCGYSKHKKNKHIMHGGAESLLLPSAGVAGVSEHLQSVSEFIQV